MSNRILIIGGTGVFGKRLARHLMTFDGIALFVSSRSAAKAESFAAELQPANTKCQVTGVALDHQTNLAEQLKAIAPFAVIDCSGPFQTANYNAARAVLEAGAHLIDLADARDYLAGFANALDATARRHNVTAMTGASSTPTLSACVVDLLTKDWRRVDTIDICITPGGKSEVGRSVIEAILSYAGGPIPIWKNGKLSQSIGWTGARLVTIPRLGRRRVAQVETYDAEYLGARHDVRSRITFSAGLESKVEQFGIEAIAFLRKHHLFPNPTALIPVLLKARKITRLPTSDAGGMLVEVSGLDKTGAFTQARWSLIARQDHGPNIPILPAAAALQNLLNREISAGAHLAHREVELSDILAQMAPYDIKTQSDRLQVKESGFESYLGAEAYQNLPTQVRAFHSQTAPAVWSGKAKITGGQNPIAKMLSLIFGFPSSGNEVPVTISIDRTITDDGQSSERWTRTFGAKSMSSVLRHAPNGDFSESFAPFVFKIALDADHNGIVWPLAGWKLGKFPLPRKFAPRSEAREFQDDQGRFRFDVRLSLPLVGLLAHYQGWLTPADKKDQT